MALKHKLFLSSWILLSSCTEEEALPQDQNESICKTAFGKPFVTAGEVNHACLHAEHGPFIPIESTAERKLVESAELTNTHTMYEINLKSNSGWVSYLPKISGDLLIYIADAKSVSFFNAQGEEICPSETEKLETCASLGTAYLVKGLQKKQDLWIGLASENNSTVRLLVEERN